MKTISIKSPNLEYYLTVERCNNALEEFLSAYLALSKVDKPPFCYHEDDIYPFSKCMEDHLEAYIKAQE